MPSCYIWESVIFANECSKKRACWHLILIYSFLCPKGISVLSGVLWAFFKIKYLKHSTSVTTQHSWCKDNTELSENIEAAWIWEISITGILEVATCRSFELNTSWYVMTLSLYIPSPCFNDESILSVNPLNPARLDLMSNRNCVFILIKHQRKIVFVEILP